MSDFLKRVGMAQAELKAPKNQYNSFWQVQLPLL